MSDIKGKYKVKTNMGWYYSSSGGRYGRFGEFQDGWRLCQSCADEVAQLLGDLNLEPELEQVRPWHCQRCQAKGWT